MLISSVPLNSKAAQDASGAQNEQVYVGDGYTVTFKIDTVWNSGYNVSVVIQNTGSETISDWYMYLKYTSEIPNMWNASVYETPSPYMVLTNAVWNKDVYPNGTAGFGFTGKGEFPGFPEFIKVTSGYDPTAMDAENDNHGDEGGDTTDDGTDKDGDGLSDAFEEAIGSNPESTDSDEDGLSDYQEVYQTLTDPTVTDTDSNGVLDPDEDIDEDGLGNLDELTGGTDPCNSDTDWDDLGDYDEINVYGCDPLNPDSDGEGLCDGDDVLLGFSPIMPDTDLNGILDSAEKIYQTTENDFAYEDAHGLTSVSVSLSVSGNIEKEIEITNVYEFDAQSRELVGLIGAPIDITCDVPFDTATISFSYEESALGDTSEENLSLMWYDEENNWYQILDQDCVVDSVNNTVSYTTTHFSKYLLVDKLLWFNTWNEDIDYPEDEDAELTYHPTRYIVIEDLSSYQSTEDTELIEEIKNTLSEFSGRFKLSREGRVLMQNGLGKTWDLYGKFDNATREYFTADGYTITPGEEADHLWSPTYRSPNLSSILDSIVYGYDTYPDYYSDRNLVIIFISNISSGASEEILQSCSDRGIKIYTIDIRNDYEDSTLKNLSDKTNGNHYYGELAQNPTLLVNSLVYVINGFTSYGSDRDTDGLLDKYEENGVRTIVGRLITTDPDKDDTDGDNLSDYEELGMVYDLNLYIGFGITKNCRFVIHSSDPNEPDSDVDGLMDNEDPHPLRKEYIEVNIQNRYDFEYLSIGDDLCGGRQGIWYNYSPYPWTENVNLEYFIKSQEYRIARCGCGLIAATDLELFFIQQNDYHLLTDSVSINTSTVDGKIDLAEYMNYVEYNEKMKYCISLSVQGVIVSVSPYDMSMWLSMLLSSNHHQYSNVQWAPFYKFDGTLNAIKTMIARDLPVIISFDNHFNNLPRLKMYYGQNGGGIDDISRAIHNDYNKTNYKDQDCDSHYMTIIGYVKYIDEKSNTQYLLKVVSWGRIYYIRYEDFAEGLNTFNNILEIK